MKAALILTGLARAWELSFPSFKRLVLDRYETDVYIDIWSEIGFYSGKSYLPETPDGFVNLKEGDKGFHTSGEIVDIKKMIEVYNPVSIRVDNFSVFEPIIEEQSKKFVKAFTRPKNTVAQAYKAARGITLFLDYSNPNDYDLMIRARPDLSIDNYSGYWHPEVFYTLPSRNKKNCGTGDSIQISNPANVIKFTQYQYNNLEQMYYEIGHSCPHMFAEKTIIDIGLQPIWTEMGAQAHVTHSSSGIPYAEPN